jgi:hypothetical protein
MEAGSQSKSDFLLAAKKYWLLAARLTHTIVPHSSPSF